MADRYDIRSKRTHYLTRYKALEDDPKSRRDYSRRKALSHLRSRLKRGWTHGAAGAAMVGGLGWAAERLGHGSVNLNPLYRAVGPNKATNWMRQAVGSHVPASLVGSVGGGILGGAYGLLSPAPDWKRKDIETQASRRAYAAYLRRKGVTEQQQQQPQGSKPGRPSPTGRHPGMPKPKKLMSVDPAYQSRGYDNSSAVMKYDLNINKSSPGGVAQERASRTDAKGNVSGYQKYLKQAASKSNRPPSRPTFESDEEEMSPYERGLRFRVQSASPKKMEKAIFGSSRRSGDPKALGVYRQVYKDYYGRKKGKGRKCAGRLGMGLGAALGGVASYHLGRGLVPDMTQEPMRHAHLGGSVVGGLVGSAVGRWAGRKLHKKLVTRGVGYREAAHGSAMRHAYDDFLRRKDKRDAELARLKGEHYLGAK